MPSKTSSFSMNKTLFLKNITRFWPIWAAYLIIWAFILPFPLVSRAQLYGCNVIQTGMSVLSSGQTGGMILGFIFGVLSAMGTFSYLYSSKNTGMIASLPVKRGAVFAVNYFSGLFWLIASNVVIFLTMFVIEACFNVLKMSVLLQWLAIVSLYCVFFYSFAVFCAVLTGHILVLPSLYVVLNFTAVVVENLFKVVLTTLVYGIRDNGASVLNVLSPIVEMTQFRPYLVNKITNDLQWGYYAYDDEYFANVSEWVFCYDGYIMLAIYAAVGIVLALLAWQIYKRRQMETATDVVAVGILRPIFKYCMCFGSGLVLGVAMYYTLFVNFDGNHAAVMALCMLLGAAVGYFASEMLMRKSFRVFGSWRGYAVAALCIVAIVGACEFDLFGYERYVPKIDKIQSVHITRYNTGDLSTPENIEAVTELHRSIIANKSMYESGADNMASEFICLEYMMKDGKVVSREYRIFVSEDILQDPSSDAAKYQTILNSQEAISNRKELRIPVTGETISFASVSWCDAAGEYQYMALTVEEMLELYDCIAKDMEAGNIGKVWIYSGEDYLRTVYDCTIDMDLSQRLGADDYMYDSLNTHPTVDSVYTNAYLQKLGIEPMLSGYAFADPYVLENTSEWIGR